MHPALTPPLPTYPLKTSATSFAPPPLQPSQLSFHIFSFLALLPSPGSVCFGLVWFWFVFAEMAVLRAHHVHVLAVPAGLRCAVPSQDPHDRLPVHVHLHGFRFLRHRRLPGGKFFLRRTCASIAYKYAPSSFLLLLGVCWLQRRVSFSVQQSTRYLPGIFSDIYAHLSVFIAKFGSIVRGKSVLTCTSVCTSTSMYLCRGVNGAVTAVPTTPSAPRPPPPFSLPAPGAPCPSSLP